MTPLKDQLIQVATVYAVATGTRSRDGGPSLSGISTRIFGDGKTFARLAAGGDITTGNFEKALRWFSAHWPEGGEWPDDIARPSASPQLAAEPPPLSVPGPVGAGE